MMNPNGSGVEPLAPPAVRAIHPNWSPNSAAVAYCTDDDLKPPAKNESEIDVIDVSTRKITRLITAASTPTPPTHLTASA